MNKKELTSSQHILLVEDDNDINRLLATYFLQANYEVTSAFSGTEALLLLEDDFDLVVLDLMLPGLCGENLILKIREKNNVPIIVISGKVALEDRVNVLDLGADDFIPKPFEKQDVLARVAAVLRRSQVYQMAVKHEEGVLLRYGNLLMNPDFMEVKWQDKAVALTQTEFFILHEMMRRPGQVFSRDKLYRAVWNEEFLGDDNAITVHISHLRQKLKQASGKDLIATVWGIGYKLSQ